jgi:hypothetical protein
LATNSIGQFEFMWMSRPPLLVYRKTIARVRPGTSGTLVQSLGEWAEPFELVTKTSAVNLGFAYDAYEAYRHLCGDNAVDITWANYPMTAVGHVYFVMDVELLEAKQLIVGVAPGGLFFAHAICRWRIQPVTDLPPP